MNDFKNIDYPTKSEMQDAVNAIVEKGVVRRQPFLLYFRDICRNVGLKHIFHDYTEIVYTLLAFAAVFLALFTCRFKIDERFCESLYAVMFTASPLLFFAVSVIAFIGARNNGTIEVEMSCKYNIYQLAAFRMFIFSVICAAFDTACAIMLTARYGRLNLPLLLALSFAGLFLFSMLFLFVLRRAHSRYTKYFAAAAWTLVTLLPYCINRRAYFAFLTGVPVYVYCVMAAVCAAVYIDNLKRLVIPKEMEI